MLRSLQILLLGLMPLALIGCPTGKQPPASKKKPIPGGVLRLPLDVGADKVNTVEEITKLGSPQFLSVAQAIEVPLARKVGNTLMPGLSTKWISTHSATTWTFQLAEGVDIDLLVKRWETVLRSKESPLRSQLCDLIKGAEEYRLGKADSVSGLSTTEATENRYFNVNLTRSVTEFPSWTSQLGLGLREDYPAFFPVDIDNGTLVLSPNDKHLDELSTPNVKWIEFVLEPDRHKQFELYKAGRLDTCNLTPDDLAAVKEDPELSKQLQEFDTAAPIVGFFDLHAAPWGNAPFKDKTPLRAAVNYAINREELSEKVGGFEPWSHFLPVPMKQFIDPPLLSTPIFGNEPDFDKALEGEKLAGHEQASLLPLNMLLSYVDSQFYEQLAIGVKDNLDDISIKMRPYPCKTREDALELVKIGSMDIWLQQLYPAYPSPDALFYPYLHSSLAGLGGNYGYLHDPDIDRMIEAAQAEPNDAARRKMYQQLSQEVEKRALMVYIGSGKAAMLINPKLAGYELTPYDFDASLPAQDFSKLGFTE
jgi:ABC-type oligopeptide transport system substrate-binding subunit